MILNAFVGKMVGRLVEFVEERVVTVLGVKDEVERLQKKMERIKSVLQDAERKRIQSAAVADWVRELKDVVYDADDIIDRCRLEGGKLLGDQPSASTTSRSVRSNLLLSSFSCCFSVSFRHEIGDKIKKLNQRLEDITKDMSGLNLVVQNKPDIPVTGVNPRQTTSLVDPDIVGEDIKRATEELVERIAKKEEGDQKCRVFAITGMGGIGKTTLAQNIFNHQKITSEFSPKIWVCISQNFSEIDLVKQIIREAGGNHGDKQTKEELLPLLQQIISGKPFFLVLDDVWGEDVWFHLLRQPLQSGAIGSRILVTTRDRNVAMHMGTVHIHPVDELPRESGWELLCKSLYSSSQEEEMQSLSDVGIQIVEKCHGLPLAIKAIAGVLRTRNRSKREWEKVLRRDAWSMDKLPDDLRGALYLSYEDLSSHLKQCFVFCSLFPEDRVFYRSDLVKYWVVEGFVPKTQEDSFLEVADEYLEDLVRRNLVQKEFIAFDERYTMHDLLRSLAQYLSQDESFCGKAHKLAILSTTTKLRRLTITDGEDVEVIPEPLLQQKSLRTLFIRSHPRLGNELFVRFPYLRLLMLSGSAIDNIPDAVGDLIHLRLLDLEGTKISSLPESIRHLTNLEVLNLSGCRSLSTLPNGITRLCNLWFLGLDDTLISFIPAGMGSLIQLNVLREFVLGEDSTSSGSGLNQLQGCSLEDLKSLKHLRELTIQHLERAHKGQMVLQNKPHLKMLQLNCGESTVDQHTNEIEEVFAELFPPPCLEELGIAGYYGRGFPGNWMMSESLGSFLPQLTRLSLCNCTNVLKLPPLGLLPELRSLYISNARAVVTMGPEFLGSSATSVVAFPKLESLRIYKMDNLEEWSFCGEEEGPAVLPHLQQLHIHKCPKLESLPRGLKQSPLKMLEISDVNLRALIGGLTDQLVIAKCNSLELISDFPELKELNTWDCPMLKSVEKVDALKRLELIEGDNECLPEWLLRLLQQRQQQMNEQQDDDDDFQLQLNIGDKLLKRCLMECEYWPIIRNVPFVNAYGSTNAAYLKYTKKPFSYDTNNL